MERRSSAGGLSMFNGSSIASSGDEERRSSTLDVPRPPQKRRSLRSSLKPIRAPQPAAQVPGENADEPETTDSFNSEPYEAHPRSPKLVASPTSSKILSFLGPHPREPLVTSLSSSPSKGGRKVHQRSNTTTSFEVKETHTMYKDYDPTTGNKKINKYMLIKEIGRGVHGKVKLGRDEETGELVAIKIVDRTSRRRLGRNNELTNEQKIRKEIAILKKCAHPNVVRLIEVIDDPMSRKIYMVLEYMEDGEVRWRDEHDQPVMTIQEARRTFREVVLGLEYLHHQGIIHRDIKPANLLLSDDGVVKISDFGVSYFSQRSAASTDGTNRNPASPESELSKTAGSPAFFAPELCFTGDVSIDLSGGSLASALANNDSSVVASAIQSRTQRPPITKAIDVWALGVTLYCFVFGRCPFIADTEFELFFYIIPRKPLEFPDDIPVSDDLRDLLSRLLEKVATKRITLEEVKRHPWVVADLPDPEKWREETDPQNYQAVTVTDEEVKSAYTLVDRLKKKFRKFSVSLGHLTLGHLRKRSKSASATSPESSDSYSHSDTSGTAATSGTGGTVPIAICPPQNHLDPGHSRHASIFGSSYPEAYTRLMSKDMKNFRGDEARSLSLSSGVSVALSVGSVDRELPPDYYLSRQSPPRHLVLKRQSNHSYSSLNQSWAEDDFKRGVNDGREGGGVGGTPNTNVGSRQDYSGNGSACDDHQQTSQQVCERQSSQDDASATHLMPAPPPPTFTGVRDLPLERFETSDTVESDDSGLVFGSMGAQGSYRS